jgi:hypothetical protein
MAESLLATQQVSQYLLKKSTHTQSVTHSGGNKIIFKFVAEIKAFCCCSFRMMLSEKLADPKQDKSSTAENANKLHLKYIHSLGGLKHTILPTAALTHEICLNAWL